MKDQHPTTAPLDKAGAAIIADRLWATFTKNDQTMVRFGMFPADKMPDMDRDGTRLLAVALMDIAQRNGGMRA